jgi:hypothetical protein
MLSRRDLLLAALRKDARLGCGVVAPGHWSTDPPLPERCQGAPLERCVFERGLEVNETLAHDVRRRLYLQVQLAAERLREAGQLTSAHRRILETLLLSDALAREE